jgi:hypothetical protein
MTSSSILIAAGVAACLFALVNVAVQMHLIPNPFGL